MNQSNEEATAIKLKRVHDQAPSDGFAEFMRGGWAPSDLADIDASPAAGYALKRRAELSTAFPGLRLVLPAGNFKIRSNDAVHRYRPHSAFAYYTGVQGPEASADAVLVLEPKASGGHDSILYIHPRSTRDTDAFYRDANYGELWVGRRFTLSEAKVRWQIETRLVADLEKFLGDKSATLIIRGEDAMVDRVVTKHEREAEFLTFVSEHRLIKDAYELQEMQAAVDATHLGFEQVVKALPEAVKHSRGERVVEGAFFAKARSEGNDLGYETISAAGSHACVLHWTRNDGEVKNGELILVDAGVERESFYTADITRTLPVNGKFTKAQRDLYMLVYESQLAGFNAIKPGLKFSDVNRTCQEVFAAGLEKLGVLPVSAAESLGPDGGYHRRWTLHGVSHHLGMDVHDCAQARKEHYTDALLEEGMVFTVEPGIYIQPDDELFPAEYRGIGIRIEDDIVVTKDGCRVLSEKLPRHPDEIEAWMASLSR